MSFPVIYEATLIGLIVLLGVVGIPVSIYWAISEKRREVLASIVLGIVLGTGILGFSFVIGISILRFLQ